MPPRDSVARLLFLRHVAARVEDRPTWGEEAVPVPRRRGSLTEDQRDHDGNLALACEDLSAEDWEAGRRWYPDEAAKVAALGAHYAVSPVRLVQAVAALSPGVRFEAALQNARILLDARARGDVDFPVGAGLGYEAPFGYRDIIKAWDLITTDKPADLILSGPKVTAFAANLLGDLEAITIDRHVTRAATAGALDQATGRTRARIEAAVRRVARDRHVAPAELQAALYIHNDQPRARARRDPWTPST